MKNRYSAGFYTLISVWALLAVPVTNAATGSITTTVGDGVAAFAGDGEPANAASVQLPFGRAAFDSAGNLYFSDTGNHRVRKVAAASGVISTVAGNGTGGYGGDNGPATDANLNEPVGVALDSADNLFIADRSNHRIRRVDAVTGEISTYAGNGIAGFAGDGGSATAASLRVPWDIELDSSGNLFIADRNNHRIRRVDSTSGLITTYAGDGLSTYGGDGGPAVSASLNQPQGVALDSTGNLYIADTENHRIRRVDGAGTITTVAGNGAAGFGGDNGAATAANLSQPRGVDSDAAGNLLIADTVNHRVRMVDSTGTITTVAGTGTMGFAGDGGLATAAQLLSPFAVAFDAQGRFHITDTGNNRQRLVLVKGGPRLLVDTTTGTASNNGTIASGEYQNFSCGINTGFSDVVGAGSRLHIDTDDAGALHFGLQRGPASLNDVAVIYIDSVPGGFSSTSAFSDTADGGRAAISGNGTGGGTSDLTFADGFGADYAITLESSFSGLFALNAGSHGFVAGAGLSNTGSDYEINLSLDQLGIAPGDFFRYVVTYLNPTNAFRSDEFHGVSPSTASSGNIGNGALTLAAGDYNTFFTAGCSRELALTQDEWRQFGAPCNTGAATVESVFVTNGNLATGDYFDGTNGTWVVYRRDAAAEEYVQLALSDPIMNGTGYWVKTTEAGKAGNLSGAKNLSPTAIALTSDAAGRFNMVGHPYNVKVNWADVRVIDPSQTPSALTLTQADMTNACQSATPLANGCVMSRIAYKWNGAAYDSFDGETPGMEGALEPLDGLWVEAFKAGISLQVPLVPTKVALEASGKSTALTSMKAKAMENRFGAWQVRLIAEAVGPSGQPLRDAGNFLGQLPDSVDGYDAHDLPERAPFGNDYLTIVFAQSEWGDANGNYNSDHRRINGPGDGTWPFEVHTSLPIGTEVTLRWEGPAGALNSALVLDYTHSTKAKTGTNGSYTFTVTAPVHRFAWQQRAWRN